jgi:hypothetical protein
MMKKSLSNDNKHRRRIALTVKALFLVSSGIIIIILPMTDAAFAATIRGNNRDNVLKGTDRRDTIHGRGGHDTIYG